MRLMLDFDSGPDEGATRRGRIRLLVLLAVSVVLLELLGLAALIILVRLA